MLIFVSRPRDPHLKPALLVDIVEHLLENPLADMTFRTLADGLGVSTYMLVYHFGSRAQLVRDVLESVAQQRLFVLDFSRHQFSGHQATDFDWHLGQIRRSWQFSLQPRNLRMQRLAFEGALLEARHSGRSDVTLAPFEQWTAAGAKALVNLGISPGDATLETRALIDAYYGVQYDALITGDLESATAVFEQAIDTFEARVRPLLATG